MKLNHVCQSIAFIAFLLFITACSTDIEIEDVQTEQLEIIEVVEIIDEEIIEVEVLEQRSSLPQINESYSDVIIEEIIIVEEISETDENQSDVLGDLIEVIEIRENKTFK